MRFVHAVAREFTPSTLAAVAAENTVARYARLAKPTPSEKIQTTTELLARAKQSSLSPLAAARLYAALLGADVSAETLAAEIGKNRTTIINMVRLLDLPQEVLGAVDAGEISVGHARAILMFAGTAARLKALSQIRLGGLSVRAAEALAAATNAAARAGAGVTTDGERLATLARKLGVAIARKGRGASAKLEISSSDPGAIERVLAQLEC